VTNRPNTTPLWVLALLDKDLSAVECRMLLYLLWRQGSNGSAWPGLRRIADDLDISESTVRRAINELRAKGWLHPTPVNKGGRGRTNHYSVKGITQDTLCQPKGSMDDTVSNKKGVIDDGKRISPVNSKHYTNNTSHLKKNIFPPNSDTLRISHLLFDLIREHDSGAKEPDFQKWAVHVDRLLRLDDRSAADVEAVVRWCQADSFWCSVILSTENLRKNFGKLFLKMKGQPRHAGPSTPARNRDFTNQPSSVGSTIEV
jgi:predicted transcriptional regulator